jgi:energy-converting hydrogenase Eha subunit F
MGDAAEGGAGKYVEEIRGDAIGYLCRQALFLQSATAYGVHGISKYLRRLIIDGVLLPVRGDDAIIEKGGEMYVVVDPSWIRVRERMKSLERKIIRQR